MGGVLKYEGYKGNSRYDKHPRHDRNYTTIELKTSSKTQWTAHSQNMMDTRLIEDR
jgi:hypothetical protein